MRRTHNLSVPPARSLVKPITPYRVVDIVAASCAVPVASHSSESGSSSAPQTPPLHKSAAPILPTSPGHSYKSGGGPTRGARQAPRMPTVQLPPQAPSTSLSGAMAPSVEYPIVLPETQQSQIRHLRDKAPFFVSQEHSLEVKSLSSSATAFPVHMTSSTNQMSKSKKCNEEIGSGIGLLHRVENFGRNARKSLRKVRKRVTGESQQLKPALDRNIVTASSSDFDSLSDEDFHQVVGNVVIQMNAPLPPTGPSPQSRKRSPPPLPRPPQVCARIDPSCRNLVMPQLGTLLSHTAQVLLPRLREGGSSLSTGGSVESESAFLVLCLKAFTKAWRSSTAAETPQRGQTVPATGVCVQPAAWVPPDAMHQGINVLTVDTALLNMSQEVELRALHGWLCAALPEKLDALLSNENMTCAASVPTSGRFALPCCQVQRLDRLLLLPSAEPQLTRLLGIIALFSAILSLRLLANSGCYGVDETFEMADILVLLTRRDVRCLLNPAKLVRRRVEEDASDETSTYLHEFVSAAKRCLSDLCTEVAVLHHLQMLSDNSLDEIAWHYLLCIYYFCFGKRKQCDSVGPSPTSPIVAESDSLASDESTTASYSALTTTLSNVVDSAGDCGLFQRNARLLLPTLFGEADVATYCLAQCVLWHDRLLNMCEHCRALPA